MHLNPLLLTHSLISDTDVQSQAVVQVIWNIAPSGPFANLKWLRRSEAPRASAYVDTTGQNSQLFDMMLSGRSSQRLNGPGLDSPTAHRSLSYSIARIRPPQSNADARTIQRATGLATEMQQVLASSPMHSLPSDSEESAHEAFQEGIQEAEASGSSSRGIYKQQASTSSRGSTGMQPFSYAPAESDQIRESWDSLMRWSKVRMTLFISCILSISSWFSHT